MIGTWTGFYNFDNKAVQQIIGFDQTGFTINIQKFDGKNFEGTVSDDIDTGGMKETGKIIGQVKKDRIAFKKFMPKNKIIVSATETRVIPEKKHPTLYYSGTFNANKTQVSGYWKFKVKFTFLNGFIPFLYRPGKGKWEMRLVDK